MLDFLKFKKDERHFSKKATLYAAVALLTASTTFAGVAELIGKQRPTIDTITYIKDLIHKSHIEPDEVRTLLLSMHRDEEGNIIANGEKLSPNDIINISLEIDGAIDENIHITLDDTNTFNEAALIDRRHMYKWNDILRMALTARDIDITSLDTTHFVQRSVNDKYRGALECDLSDQSFSRYDNGEFIDRYDIKGIGVVDERTDEYIYNAQQSTITYPQGNQTIEIYPNELEFAIAKSICEQ